MGYFDLATTIDFVLAKTGKEKLSLIGYSMGSLLSYVLLSHKPDYNKKINLNISAGAIAFIAPSTVSYLQRFINSHFRYIKVSFRKILKRYGGKYSIFKSVNRIGKNLAMCPCANFEKS